MTRMHVFLCLLVIGGLIAVYVARRDIPPAEPVSDPTSDVMPFPPFTESVYLNTGPDARYIGTPACAKCHQENHKSYMLTAHSKAFSDIDPSQEPPDAAFEHKASGRSYRVYRKEGQFRHEELLRTTEGEVIGRIDLPVRYLIGSGHYSRSYLIDVDGFLHLSPITWYTAKNKWDMSPGFDIPNHASFERTISLACVQCHAGRVEMSSEKEHQIAFLEKAIGCESCHGPGSLHQDFHRSKKLAPGEVDRTIVHPGKLPRPLLESVCATCHLSSVASIPVRGRQAADTRPGRPLSDYQIDFRIDAERDEMTVVGHVEQLRQSLCYQKSPDLSCVTCHDPHAQEKPRDSVAFYRKKCLDCHDTKPCSVPVDQRLKKNPADNCAACHMPRGDTDIPHVAFSHHRIGRHSPPQTLTSGRIPDLVPLDHNPHLSPLERDRNLGLAYLQSLERNPRLAEYGRVYFERGLSRLHAVHQAGLKDPEVVFALANAHRGQNNFAAAEPLAREYLEMKTQDPEKRAIMLLLLGYSEWTSKKDPDSIRLLEEAVRFRRYSEDWRMLGAIHLDLTQPDRALPALQQALIIQPFRNVTHQNLAEAYRQKGDLQRSQQHRDKANWLRLHGQD